MAASDEGWDSDNDALDMERVVIDPDYRRRVIGQLRRRRAQAEGWRPKADALRLVEGGEED